MRRGQEQRVCGQDFKEHPGRCSLECPGTESWMGCGRGEHGVEGQHGGEGQHLLGSGDRKEQSLGRFRAS